VLKHSLIATVGLGLFALSARAQDKPAAPGADTRPRWVVACEGDIKKHCVEAAKTGDPRSCLADHEKDLTQDCKDAFIKQYRIVQLCREDMEKLCAGISGRALGQCLNDKREQLSPKCLSALTRGSREHEKAEAKAEAAKEEPPAPKKKKAAKTAK
jgi:hypothetical protein